MVAEVIDYRVSRIVVLCKDCGQDVGLYPARHKCGADSSDAVPVPALPKEYQKQQQPSGSGVSGWAKLKAAREEGKLNNAAETYGASDSNHHEGQSGLWNKLRGVRDWKSMNEGNSTAGASQGAKLWDKLLSATSTLKDNIANYGDESDADSDKEGWDGETHISRILREYHEKKSGTIPDWLYGSSMAKKRTVEHKNSPAISSSSQNALEQDTTSATPAYSKKSFRDIYKSAASDRSNVTTSSSSLLSADTARDRYRDNRFVGSPSSLPNTFDPTVNRSASTPPGNPLSPMSPQAQYYAPATRAMRSPSPDARTRSGQHQSQHSRAERPTRYDAAPAPRAQNRARSVSPNPTFRSYTSLASESTHGRFGGSPADGYTQYGGGQRGRTAGRQGGYI